VLDCAAQRGLRTHGPACRHVAMLHVVVASWDAQLYASSYPKNMPALVAPGRAHGTFHMRAEHLCECGDPLWPLHPCSQPDLERSARSTIICPNGIGKTVAAEPPLLADSAALGTAASASWQLAISTTSSLLSPRRLLLLKFPVSQHNSHPLCCLKVTMRRVLVCAVFLVAALLLADGE
jgi:hypothetical protein